MSSTRCERIAYRNVDSSDMSLFPSPNVQLHTTYRHCGFLFFFLAAYKLPYSNPVHRLCNAAYRSSTCFRYGCTLAANLCSEGPPCARYAHLVSSTTRPSATAASASRAARREHPARNPASSTPKHGFNLSEPIANSPKPFSKFVNATPSAVVTTKKVVMSDQIRRLAISLLPDSNFTIFFSNMSAASIHCTGDLPLRYFAATISRP
jgi:hypothetical protein